MKVSPRRKPRISTYSVLVCLEIIFGQVSASQSLPRQDVPVNPIPSVVEFDNVAVPMRDKVVLRADVYLPPGGGRWPAILIRTPYGRRSETTRGYRFFADHGYAVVAQDVR